MIPGIRWANSESSSWPVLRVKHRLITLPRRAELYGEIDKAAMPLSLYII